MTRFNLSEWALNHRQMIVFMLVIFTVAGLFAYSNLGQEEDPTYTVRSMTLKAYWPGATVYNMENQVADKFEQTLQTIDQIDNVQSETMAGYTMLTITVHDDVPPAQVAGVWYDVRKKIGDMEYQLPKDVQGPFFNDDYGQTFGNIYALTGDGFSYAQLKQFAKSLRRDILGVPAVDEVNYVGDQDQEIFIEMSNAKLASLGIDPMQILKVLAQTNSVQSAGTVQTRSDQVQLRVSGEFDSLDSIRNIGIRSGDRVFKLGDIATVKRGYVDPPVYKMFFDGKPAVGLAISMRSGGNVIQLGKELDAIVTRTQNELPVGVRINTVSDQPVVVKQSVSEFTTALFEAVGIVLIVSFLSLGLRTGFVVALCIPFVLAMTFLVMYFAGIDLQQISLGALIIALGLLVDDAIITVEMMSLKLEEGMDHFHAATFAYTSTAFPMLTGTLVTAAGFLPVALAKSGASEYTISIFQVVTVALLLSWITAVVFTPYLGYKLLKEKKHSGPVDEYTVYQKPFYRWFRARVTWCLDHRGAVVGVTVLLFVAAIGLFAFVPKQFFPLSDRNELVVDMWLPQAATFVESERQATLFDNKIKSDPDVVSYITYVGAGSPRFYLPLKVQSQNTNLAEIVLLTKNVAARERVFSHVRRMFDNGFPLVRGRVTRLENGPPVGYPVQFRISGPDWAKVVPAADKVMAIMRANPNLREVNSDRGEDVLVLHVNVAEDKARALGVTSKDVSNALAASLSGIVTTQYRQGDQNINVVGRLISKERTDISNIGDLMVHLADGSFVPLSQLATVTVNTEPSVLWRRNRVPTVTVRADMQTDAQANDVTKALWPKIETVVKTLPPGYTIAIGGSQESSSKGQKAIIAVMPLVGILVMFLLMIQLQDMRKMILVLLTAPLGMIGVTAILLIFQIPFGFVAMLGIVALFGMIIRNSVILVTQIDKALTGGMAMREAIIESAVHRCRPIVLTAATAVLAMIPLTRSTFWAPMAWAIMGGLIGATVLTLLYLPSLYALWYRVEKKKVSHAAK
ncbi:MAG: efflux RND transporter permease subunit [Gammaproteobacteria bacterium]